jgi:hypothetical protein
MSSLSATASIATTRESLERHLVFDFHVLDKVGKQLAGRSTQRDQQCLGRRRYDQQRQPGLQLLDWSRCPRCSARMASTNCHSSVLPPCSIIGNGRISSLKMCILSSAAIAARL